MKKCPKCGYKNAIDANFCSKCSEKLESTTRQLKVKKSRRITFVILALVVLVTINLSAIFFLNRGDSNKQGHDVAKTSTSKEDKKKSSKKKDKVAESSSNSSKKLTVNDLTPAQTAAAIIYYGTQDADLNKPMEGWVDSYESGGNITIYVTKNDNSKLASPGQNVRYAVAKAGNKGAVMKTMAENYYTPSYTIDTDGTINYYGLYPLEPGTNIVKSTKSVKLTDVVKYIDMSKVDLLAERIDIQDVRNENTGNLITEEDVNSSQLLRYKALVFYGIKNFEQFKILSGAPKILVVEAGNSKVNVVPDQAGSALQIYHMYTSPDLKIPERYSFGYHEVGKEKADDFITATRNDGKDEQITNIIEVITFVNENGGRSALDGINIAIYSG